jgi:preprotein translocase SecE subunit
LAGLREQIEKFRTFLSEVNQEMRRITWPTPREIAGATVVVMVAAALVAVLLSLYDMIIAKALGVVFR